MGAGHRAQNSFLMGRGTIEIGDSVHAESLKDELEYNKEWEWVAG